jgi:plasmid replication initiation protein
MALLPEHHPVRDLFVCDVLDVVPRSDMASMEHPVFSLSTKPDMRTLRYENDGRFVEIQPSVKGLATVHDKDLLIYCVSKVMHRKNQGEAISQVVRITTHDFLVSTNRRTGGIVYERLEDALDRLAGTRIKTNIETGSERETKNFGLIEWYDYNRKGSGFTERLQYLDIKLSDWLFRAIEAAEVLTISREYFRLRSPLDRRIYEIARKHCGSKQEKWRIGIDKLQRKTGSKQERKHFVAHLREMVQSNHLPDYALTLEDDQVVFWRRAGEGDAQRQKPVGTPPVMAEAFIKAPERPIFLSERTIERVREIAPGWDKYYLKHAYIDFFTGKDAAKNEEARFLGWVKNFTKGQPPP